MTLVAYADESATHEGQVLVYAGYVARIGDWERLTAEWQACLNDEPKLDYFKMNEAWHRRGKWAVYRRPLDLRQRDFRLREFYRIVSAHVLGGVSIVLPIAEFKAAIVARPEVPRQQKNKHFFLMYNLMHDLLRSSEHLGLDEPIDFVFDNQSRGKEQIFHAWESFSKGAPIPKRRLGNAPSFSDDKEVLPLQAADFLAWAVRRNAVKFLSKQPEEKFPWSDFPIKYRRLTRVWTTVELTEYVKRVVRSQT